MSGHRGFRLGDEVAGLKCVCAASLTDSRILIGEHSSERMRAAGAAPVMCVRPVTAPPRGLAQCVDSHSEVFKSRRQLQCWPRPGGRSLQNGPPTQNTGRVVCHRFGVWRGTRDRNSGSKLALVETTWKHGKDEPRLPPVTAAAFYAHEHCWRL